jgi:hypothetical protein
MERESYPPGKNKKLNRSFDKANPDIGRRYAGTGGTKIRGKIENAVGIEARYKPNQQLMKVLEVYPLQSKGKTIEYSNLQSQHKDLANKMLDKPLVKGFVTKTAKMFQKANDLIGERHTGARAAAGARIISAAQKTGNLDRMAEAAEKAEKMSVQHFSLSGVRNRMSKLGKAGKVLGLGLAAYDMVRNFQKE